MEKIKCYNCDFYLDPKTEKGKAYCRQQEKFIAPKAEKARCKDYGISDLRFRCARFQPWVETPRGIAMNACYDEATRHTHPCNQRNHPERCGDYVPKYGKD